MNGTHLMPNGARRVKQLLLVIIISGLLVSCSEAPAATVTGSGYEVKEQTNAAWGSIIVLNPLDALSTNVWTWLLPNGMVTTDSNGVAELRNNSIGCAGLYVFRDSGIETSPCTADMSGSWNCVVGAAASANCNVGLASPSTNVTTRGTWYSLISVDGGRLSIVTVLDGEVEVVPVTQLDYKYQVNEDHSFALTFNQRVVDDKQTITLDKDQSTYTASDEYLATHFSGMSLPPARTPLDPAQFQELIGKLLPIYPDLDGYLKDVGQAASSSDLSFPPPQEILMQGKGGFLEDTDKQQAVLLSVNWYDVQKNVSSNQLVSLAYSLPGNEGLLTEQPFNPDLAPIRAIVTEYKLMEPPILLLVPAGDKTLITMAQIMTRYFDAVGLAANIEEIAPVDMQAKADTTTAAGMPVLWLGWR